MQKYELTFSDGLVIIANEDNVIRLHHDKGINGDVSDLNAIQIFNLLGVFVLCRTENSVTFDHGAFSLSPTSRKRQSLITITKQN